ncbi:integral membrane protein, interacts with FtsH [Thiohalobacter thiocyanaticus]|uniref:Integral membrane protein, interacts with FtsH n=1 Tax=Thiohalobacter thiocyanaticus TaxID=585455 RepID=A0A1Z4VSA7_9GAMM|nr:Bax inhibitor-1/YccA family protein [Thiohalobacter thiocyanaticus]BAZ94302.1 integral membrane protein, interacts with FtsH [Thiohalobacter thiocyanaticus]
MNTPEQMMARSQTAMLATNKLLRNTFTMLSMTLIFSAVMASVSIVMSAGFGLSLVAMLVAFGLLWFALPRTENSAAGIGVVFAFTGLMGFSLGPILSHYLALPNGGQLIATALGGTGVIFMGLSGYAMTTKRDFSFMAGFLFVGLIVVMIAAIANIFLAIPAMSLAISAAVVLLMSGLILFDVSRIVNGGETNYLRATVALYLDIHNLFIHLLHLLAAFSGRE